MQNFSTFILCLFIFSCANPNVPFDKEKAILEILEIHEQQRDIHFKKLAEELVGQLSLNHISVNRGEVSTPESKDLTEVFQNYFDEVEFIKWDDTNPPIIRFSDDGSLAYTVVEKDLLLTYVDEEQRTIEEYTKFAWVAIYKKYGDKWKMDCMASTDKPAVSYLSPKVMIKSINSLANCTGPNGKYTTEISTAADGYLFFKQTYDYKPESFQAAIFDDSTGFALNENESKKDELSLQVISMIRGHDFHMMAFHPENYFSEIKFIKRDSLEGKIMNTYKAKDQLGNPVLLYRDINFGKLTGLILKNSLNTEEDIEIYYRAWQESDYGPLVNQVDILQNVIDNSNIRKDTFQFDFFKISINDRNFKKIQK